MPELDTGRDSGSVLVSRLLSGAVVAVLATLAVVIWWARNRGLDLTDEGYYLQLYAHPEAAPPDVVQSQFYVLVDLVTGPSHIGLAGYRVMALLLLLASGAFFGFSLHRFTSARIPEIAMPPLLMTVSFVAVAGLLGYSWAPLAVSYNTLAATLVHIVAGLTLLALAGADGPKMVRGWVAYAVIAGGLFPFLFYAKWPASVLLASVLAMFVLVVLGRAGLKLLMIVAASGIALLSLVTDELLGGPFSIGAVFASAGGVSASGHQPTELIKNYSLWMVADTARVLWQDPLRLLALVLLLVGGSLAVIARSRFGWIRVWMLPTIGALYLVVEIPGASYLERTTNFKLVAALALAVSLSVFIAQTIRTGQLPDLSVGKLSRSSQLTWLLILLGLGLALVTGAGSNSHILTTSLHGGAGYGAVLVVVLASLRSLAGDEGQFSFSVALPVLAVVFAAQIVNGVVVDPYRLTSARVEQTTSVSGIPRLEGISFDEASGEFLSEVNRLVYQETSFAPGDTVLAFASIPGLVYMIDGVFPGVPWISPPETERQGDVCSVLRAVGDDMAGTTLILQNSPPSPELAICIQELLPGYPEQFMEVGGVAIPDGYGSGNSLGDTLRVFEFRP